MITVYKLLNDLLGVSEELFFLRGQSTPPPVDTITSCIQKEVNLTLNINSSVRVSLLIGIACPVMYMYSQCTQHRILQKTSGQALVGRPIQYRHSWHAHPVSYLVQLHSNMTNWPECSQDVILRFLGGISSSVLSVFFTDNCYKLLKSLHLIGWEQICQWKTLTKHLMKCPPDITKYLI